MDILYLSTACTEKEYQLINKSIKRLRGQQAGKFNRLFAEGLAKNGCNVTMYSSRPVSSNIHPKVFYKAKQEVYENVHYIYPQFYNVKYIRQLMLLIETRKYIKKWCKKHKEGVILCDVLNFTLLAVASNIVKSTKNKLIGIVTDLPEMSGECKLNKRVIKQKEYIYNCDGLVLLAEPMNNVINPLKKPFVIIEGFCDINMSKVENILDNKYDNKVVMYAGTIYREYGVETLVKAFINANVKDTELHIYGVGDYEEELNNLVQKYDNIKYFGAKTNDIIVEEEIKASLLVNPRPIDEDFIQYSFPSKNMEYIISGTPMLTTNLPSMPDEYHNYCFVSKGYTVKDLEEELKIILSKSKEDLNEFGHRAKQWALDNKNNVVLAKRGMDFIGDIK